MIPSIDRIECCPGRSLLYNPCTRHCVPCSVSSLTYWSLHSQLCHLGLSNSHCNPFSSNSLLSTSTCLRSQSCHHSLGRVLLFTLLRVTRNIWRELTEPISHSPTPRAVKMLVLAAKTQCNTHQVSERDEQQQSLEPVQALQSAPSCSLWY